MFLLPILAFVVLVVLLLVVAILWWIAGAGRSSRGE